ncbi:SRPBCC family protein [Nocardia goodfellowii]
MPLLSDPTALAGLVTREVRTGSRGGAATRIAVAQRSYPTDQADLWDALTDIERIPRWFLPISGSLEVGGSYQLEGNAHGVVERCDAPKGFAVTWEMGDQVSWLEVVLSPVGDGTQLTLMHEAPIDPEMWTRFGPGAAGVGWDLSLMGLGMHLESGEPVDPAVALTLHTTPEGIEFIRAAATAWGAAAIADGDDATTARVAAEQTFDAYTAEREDGHES